MESNSNSTRIKRHSMKQKLLSTVLLSLMICSSTWAGPTLLSSSPRNAPRLSLMSDQDDSSTQEQEPSLILVDREKLGQLVDKFQKCATYAGLCAERVMLFEAYKEDADATIKAQEETLYICKEQVESEKRKSWLIPVLGILGGFALGFAVTR